jgi:hypothetical protein
MLLNFFCIFLSSSSFIFLFFLSGFVTIINIFLFTSFQCLYLLPLNL